MSVSEKTGLKHKCHLELTQNYDIVHKISDCTEICTLHSHDYFEIIFNINGNLTFCIEDIKYALVPGDIIIIPPGKMHRHITVKKDAVYERYVLFLNPDYVEKLTNNLAKSLNFIYVIKDNYGHLVHFEPTKLKKIEKNIEHIYNIYTVAAAENSEDINCLIYRILSDLTKQLKKCGQTHQLSEDGIIPSVIKYINNNLNENLSLDSISQYFCVNKFHLLHEFRKYTNSTVYDYIISKRIIFAKRLIRDGYSINDACKKCGASDYSNFFKSFVKRTGISPNEYKKKCRK